MNPNTGLKRLSQPRSNLATNMLFGITFVVFAMLADTAMQQQGEIAHAGDGGASAAGAMSVMSMDLRTLIRRPHF